MKKILYLAIFSCISFTIAGQMNIYDFPNQIPVFFTPDSPDDNGYYFSTKGTWFGFSLPEKNDIENLGSFCGPYDIFNKKWISKKLLSLDFDVKGNEELKFSDAKNIEINQYPGSLYQMYEFDNFKIEQKLIYVSTRTSLYVSEVINTSRSDISIKLNLHGEVFDGFGQGDKFVDGWTFSFADENAGFFVVRFRVEGQLDLGYSEKSYNLSHRDYNIIKPGDTLRIVGTVSQYFINDQKDDIIFTSEVLEKPLIHINNNENQWNVMVKALYAGDSIMQEIAVKSIQTIFLNMRSPLPVFINYSLNPEPLTDKNYIDVDESWLYSMAFLRFDPNLSLHQIIANVLMQNEDGSIKDSIFYTGPDRERYSVNSKPLAAWLMLNIYNVLQDREFLAQFFPMLEKYHEFWYKYRNQNDNLWCENDNGIETVELNALLYLEKHALKNIAEELGYTDKSEKYLSEINNIQTNFTNYFFYNSESGFSDFDIINNEKIVNEKAFGYALWSGLALYNDADIFIKKFYDYSETEKIEKLFWDSDIEYSYYLLMGLQLYNKYELVDDLKKLLINKMSKDFNSELSSLKASIALLLLYYI